MINVYSSLDTENDFRCKQILLTPKPNKLKYISASSASAPPVPTWSQKSLQIPTTLWENLSQPTWSKKKTSQNRDVVVLFEPTNLKSTNNQVEVDRPEWNRTEPNLDGVKNWREILFWETITENLREYSEYYYKASKISDSL